MSEENTRTIYIDGDACPVKEQVIAVARQFRTPVVIICSVAHYTDKRNAWAQWVFLDSSYQNVDMAIVNRAHAGDVIVTQDYGLASLLLQKGCKVLHHSGFCYTQENIDRLLMERHISAKIRKAGGRTKGPSALVEKDRQRFRTLLVNALREQ